MRMGRGEAQGRVGERAIKRATDSVEKGKHGEADWRSLHVHQAGQVRSECLLCDRHGWPLGTATTQEASMLSRYIHTHTHTHTLLPVPRPPRLSFMGRARLGSDLVHNVRYGLGECPGPVSESLQTVSSEVANPSRPGRTGCLAARFVWTWQHVERKFLLVGDLLGIASSRRQPCHGTQCCYAVLRSSAGRRGRGRRGYLMLIDTQAVCQARAK